MIRAVDPEDLPVDLPHLDDYKPHGKPEPPLGKSPDEWLYPVIDGKRYKRETNTMPQWAGSCWYYLRFIDPKNGTAFLDREKERAWMPVDLYIAGCMPRPEAVITGLRQLMDNIAKGEANGWQDYYRRYDYYLGNQQRLFGETWQTPTDVIAEAKHYDLFGPETLGKHTELLLQHQKPLEALEMRLGLDAPEKVKS